MGEQKKNQIRHHARPRRAPATAPLPVIRTYTCQIVIQSNRIQLLRIQLPQQFPPCPSYSTFLQSFGPSWSHLYPWIRMDDWVAPELCQLVLNHAVVCMNHVYEPPRHKMNTCLA